MTQPLFTRRQAVVHIVFVALTALACAALVAAAALAQAPAVVLPLVVAVGIGFPMLAACELPAALRAWRTDHALDALRRQLERLPETEHPLGL